VDLVGFLPLASLRIKCIGHGTVFNLCITFSLIKVLNTSEWIDHTIIEFDLISSIIRTIILCNDSGKLIKVFIKLLMQLFHLQYKYFDEKFSVFLF
jgi:hypothetical protein